MRTRRALPIFALLIAVTPACLAAGQTSSGSPTSVNILRGAYGPYRANNDLLFYHLDVRVDPAAKSIRGTNTIRLRMLADGTRIQLELTPVLAIDSVKQKGKDLKFTREGTTFFVDFPEPLKKGKTYEMQVAYSGQPKEIGRFGGMVFKTDPQGKPFIVTSCEDEGASVWWPNKDQWKDEPQQGVEVSVAVPNALTAVSNGHFLRKRDLHDGYTRWDWRVTYPINNYDVSLNIADYAHFSDKLGKLDLNFFAQPENLDKAKVQFAQAKPMLEIFSKYFGPYPFMRDGYKLIEVPYTGMEHQSAVTYGNGYHNSYGKGDWTGVGISPKFDFIIIHESGHEWFGNSVTAADRSDMWIHEGFTTYMEDVYVEAMFGHDAAIRYVNGYQKKVKNDRPILQPRGINQDPSQDQYFKGTLFLNTLRSVVDDDAKWFATLHDLAKHFVYQTILTEDIIAFMNTHLGADYTPLFNAYLRHTEVPVLELRYNDVAGTVDYRWLTPEADFNMPVRAGDPQHWTLLHPTTTAWQTILGRRDSFSVDTQHYFVSVEQDPGQQTSQTTAAGRPGWKLTWSDEFIGTNGTKPDAAKWTAEQKGDGFGNNELESYTERTSNLQQADGSLVITARKEDFSGADGVHREYTSARIQTRDKFAQKYGRIEARIKLPVGGQGIWPAFWMLGDDIRTAGWPKSGEIDIMEQIGREPGKVHGTLHGPGYSGGNPLTGEFTLPPGKRFSDDYHVFAMEWEPTAIRFYVDDVLYETQTAKEVPDGSRWVFDHPFFLLLNLAVGGNWPGKPDATTSFPTSMMVDWVRVYEKL